MGWPEEVEEEQSISGKLALSVERTESASTRFSSAILADCWEDVFPSETLEDSRE